MKKLKISLVALAINLLVLGGTAYASFPAKKEKAAEQTTSVTDKVSPALNNATIQANDKTPETVVAADALSRGDNEKWITLALWFFLGGFAAHRWYKKKPIGWNILYIITLGGCGIWALVDLINILTDNF